MNDDRHSRIRVDRRTTIKWLAATMVAANTGCSSSAKFIGEEIPPPPNPGEALLGVADIQDGISYGTDPDLMNPLVPWSRNMTAEQLETTARLVDLILPADDQSPAASTVGVPDFIDEWVSAPYATQGSDRELILAGLEWLEQQSQTLFRSSFVDSDNQQATELLDSIAWPDRRAADLTEQGRFFERFRYLAVGAYYTTEEGMGDIGYIGNVPIGGEYPGPSDEAMAHLAGVLKTLDLTLPG